jgi:hypothetical protein
MATRRARAELSSPEHAHEAGKRSSPPDRSGRGADGVRRGGLVRGGGGKLRLAAWRRGMDRASWRAAGTGSRAGRRRPAVMGKVIQREKEGRRERAPGRRSRQLMPGEEVGDRAPPRRRK